MSMSAQMNRYEVCLICGSPVPLGMPCPACTSSAPKPLTYAPNDHVREQQGPLVSHPPMTLRDYFAGQALAGGLCSGSEPEYQLKEWFGERMGVTKVEIVAKQAYAIADAMIAARKEQPHD